MKKILSFLLVCGFLISANAQWSPTKQKRNAQNEIFTIGNSYQLDLVLLKNQLKNAQEMGQYSTPVEITIPTLHGNMEKFAVYSFPVVVKELADQYQLGSYIGTSIQDPTKTVRFSVSPSGFQSMIFSNNSYEFIDPISGNAGNYLVHPKTLNTGGKSFICTTEEASFAKNQIDDLLNTGSNFANHSGNYNKSSDRKYRTMRLAISVNAEYTTYFGGVANALAAINATMTRVNGVFEKDFALHLNLQNYPSLIYTNAATDPYTSINNWNQQLQTTLTNVVGEANYDIGHMFGKSGGGGNAGCIGCVCISPTGADPLGKGSGITSPANGIPQGDTFDIDYVAHEMGHQLGATHTFTHIVQGGTSMEPGSGSTIMGYAGITGPDTDVQPNSDPYFHAISIVQVQSNLGNKTCDIETPVANNIPVIGGFPTYNIPKSTAFVLSATVTDPENDPMTFTWEQVDNSSVVIDKFNLGNTTTGPAFRSVNPTTGGATRYFPRLSSVLAGVLDNSNNLWEAVPTVARNMAFAITVRDNNPAFNQQQTTNLVQNIIVGNDGPFTVTTTVGGNNAPTPVTWNVANTSAAPYNVANVKIDYTTNGGATWINLIASTPNDGSEDVIFTGVPTNTSVKLRVSAIGNVFYAVNTVNVSTIAACTGAAPTNLSASMITATSANLSWGPVTGATYTVRYRQVGNPTWITVNTNSPTLSLTGLSDTTAYEYQVLAICSATTSPYSASFNFTTSGLVYCTASSVTAANLFINNVTISNVVNPSAGAVYSNFTTNPTLQINMTKGNTYPMTITSNVSAADFAMVFIDYNKDGVFDTTERVLNFPVTSTSTFTNSFTIPTTAVAGQTLRMRVILGFAGSANLGLFAPATWVCGTNNFNDGEVEDYNVVLAENPLATSEIKNSTDGVQIYPNPVSDILNITKVSNKALYEIYSVSGQLLSKGNVRDGKVNVSQLTTGNYIIKISDKMVEANFKFIKR